MVLFVIVISILELLVVSGELFCMISSGVNWNLFNWFDSLLNGGGILVGDGRI